MAAAWRAFANFKHMLCSRRHALASRFKLFDTVITPAALYGSSAWTVKEDARKRLLTAWRKMLRKIVQVPRRCQETWVEYVIRSARECEKYMQKFGRRDWAAVQKGRKSHFATAASNDTQATWSTRLPQWKPFFRTAAQRPLGRPRKRWGDAA
eukprot:4843207-Pyramimonas_sp.AAC.1